MSDERHDETPVGEADWLTEVDREVQQLLRSHACLRCRLNRRVMSATASLEDLVAASADDRSVWSMAANVTEYIADARSALHDCGCPDGP